MSTEARARRARAQAYLAFAVLALVWGYNWVVAKVATRDASVIVIAALRSWLGAATLLAFLAVTGRSLRPPPFLPTAILGLLQTALFALFATAAVSVGGAGKVVVLVYTMPLWLALLARVFLGERLTPRRWFALALAGAGLAFIFDPFHSRSMLASALAVTTGLVWAASAVWAIKLRTTSHDLLALTTWQMVWGSLMLLPVVIFVPWHLRWTLSFAAAIAYSAVATNALGWVLWLFILSRLPAGVVGVASLATPVVGLLAAAVQLHETPSVAELVGMGSLLLALLVNSRAGAERSTRR